MKIKDTLLKMWNLYRKSFIPLMIIFLITFVRDNYIEGSSGFYGVALTVFIKHIFGVALACFIFKLWEDEKIQIKNFARPFVHPDYRVKVWVMIIFSTFFTMLFVYIVMSVLEIETDDFITQLLLFAGMSGVYNLFLSVIDQIVDIIFAVFILRPQGSPFKIFLKGIGYNVRYLIPYCILDYVLMIIPNQIVDMLKPHMGGIYVALIVSPLVGFTFLVKAGFLYEIITWKEKKKISSRTINTYKDIDKLYKRFNKQLFIMIILLLISGSIISISTSLIIAFLFILVVELLAITLILKKNVGYVDKILFEDCDAVKFLDLIEYSVKNKKKALGKNLYKLLYSRLFTANIVLERYDVVEQLLEKEKKNSANYKLFKANCEISKARSEKNTEKYIYVYELAPEALKRIEISKYYYLLAQGKKQEAFEFITSYTGKRKYDEVARQKVLANYYIDEGNLEEARKYMQFVFDNANTLPARKAAEKWLADNGYISFCYEPDMEENESAQEQEYAEKTVSTDNLKTDTETVCAKETAQVQKTVYTSGRKKKNRIKPILVAVLLCIVLIVAGVFIHKGVQENENNNSLAEVPPQAMDFIQVYSSFMNDEDFYKMENHFLGFGYLLYNNMIPEEYNHYSTNGVHETYRLPFATQMDIYQFMIADSMPESWWQSNEVSNFAIDYIVYDVNLNLKELNYENENTFNATFEKTENGIPCYDIMFTMEKQVVDYVPKDLSDKFNIGDEVWRIKNVQQVANEFNTEPQTVKIKTKEEFLQFAEEVRTNSYNLQGNTYLLETDIDLAGIKFEPILNKADNNLRYSSATTDALMGFNGIFDGQGHTISNLEIAFDCSNIDNNDQPYTPVGLFGHIGEEGQVLNLNITGADISYMSDKDMYPSDMGIIAGSSSGKIYNCHVEGQVSGAATVGGLVGTVRDGGIVDSCTVNATVTGYNEVGVLLGNIHMSTASNCTAQGETIGEKNKHMDNKVFHDTVTPYAVGGMFGRIQSSTVMECHSDTSLKIMATGKTIGAFAASAESSSIIDCTYSKSKVGNWKLIGYYHGGYDANNTYAYQLEGK